MNSSLRRYTNYFGTEKVIHENVIEIGGIELEDSDKEISFIFKNISSYEMNFDSSEITERFTRGDKSRSTEGSGLGLAIAKNLVELQKGRLNIHIDGDLFKLIVTFPKTE